MPSSVEMVSRPRSLVPPRVPLCVAYLVVGMPSHANKVRVTSVIFIALPSRFCEWILLRFSQSESPLPRDALLPVRQRVPQRLLPRHPGLPTEDRTGPCGISAGEG